MFLISKIRQLPIAAYLFFSFIIASREPVTRQREKMWKRKEGEQERYVNRKNVKDTNGHHEDGTEGKPTDRDKEAGTQIE